MVATSYYLRHLRLDNYMYQTLKQQTTQVKKMYRVFFLNESVTTRLLKSLHEIYLSSLLLY